MEIDEQKRTYAGFMTATKYGIIAVTLLLLAMTGLI